MKLTWPIEVPSNRPSLEILEVIAGVFARNLGGRRVFDKW